MSQKREVLSCIWNCGFPCHNLSHSSFPTLAWQNSTQKKNGEKGHSPIHKVLTQEYINIHKHIHGVGFKEHTSQALREIHKFAIKETATQDVPTRSKLNNANEIRNVPHCICVWLSRKQKEDAGSSNKLYTLVTYISVSLVQTSPDSVRERCGWELTLKSSYKTVNKK